MHKPRHKLAYDMIICINYIFSTNLAIYFTHHCRFLPVSTTYEVSEAVNLSAANTTNVT